MDELLLWNDFIISFSGNLKRLGTMATSLNVDSYDYFRTIYVLEWFKELTDGNLNYFIADALKQYWTDQEQGRCGCFRSTCCALLRSDSFRPCAGCGINISKSCVTASTCLCLCCFWLAVEVYRWPFVCEEWVHVFPSFTVKPKIPNKPLWCIVALPSRSHPHCKLGIVSR